MGEQRIVKPDSVALPNRKRDGHSSCPVIAHGVQRPYPRAFGRTTRPSYLVLLRVGFTMRPPSLTDRWALTSPFQPYSTVRSGRDPPGGVFSVALSLDRSRPPLTATLSCGVRTFLLRVDRGSDRLIHCAPRLSFLITR